jgi:hypothetical protein
VVDLGHRDEHTKIDSGVDLFVRGPVDWRWIVAASRLGRCAGTMVWGLWLLAGLRKAPFTVDAWPFRELGVSRATVDRTLAALEHSDFDWTR